MDVGKNGLRPQRPPSPTIKSIASFKQSQAVKAKLGQSTRSVTISSTNKGEFSKLEPGRSKLKSLASKFGKKIQNRVVVKLDTTKSKLTTTLGNMKTKLSHYNDVRKEWQSSPRTNSLELGKMAIDAGKSKIKGSGLKLKNKASLAKNKLQNLHEKTKEGHKVWSSDKKGVTQALFAEAAISSKQKLTATPKKLKEYAIKKFNNTKKSIASAKLRIASKVRLLKLNDRKCELAPYSKKNPPPRPAPPNLNAIKKE